MPDLPNLDWLIRWAEQAGAPEHRLKAAARELVNVEEELACPPDPRRVATLRKANRLLASGTDRKSSGLPRSTFNRLLRMARLSRANLVVAREFAAWASSPAPEDRDD